jgi:hypothetical protein
MNSITHRSLALAILAAELNILNEGHYLETAGALNDVKRMLSGLMRKVDGGNG